MCCERTRFNSLGVQKFTCAHCNVVVRLNVDCVRSLSHSIASNAKANTRRQCALVQFHATQWRAPRALRLRRANFFTWLKVRSRTCALMSVELSSGAPRSHINVREHRNKCTIARTEKSYPYARSPLTKARTNRAPPPPPPPPAETSARLRRRRQRLNR